MSEVCSDNRFELIGEFKSKLVEGTNIETSPEEMAVLDNILFRIWQMGWLDKLKAQEPITGETSDGYHTFNELYHHRAVLFSVIVANYKDRAWKSVRHHDGTMYDGMFIVGIDTPDGQATYHYNIDPYWDMFDCKVREFAPEWDGHTPAQAIERISKLKAQKPHLVIESDFDGADEYGYIPVWTEEKDGDMYWECIPKVAITNPDGIEVLRYWTSRPDQATREAVPWKT